MNLQNRYIDIDGHRWLVEECELQRNPIYKTPKLYLKLFEIGYIEDHLGLSAIKKVIFNGPATIVFWKDGTKTVVKCAEGENYDKRVAIMWAAMKKMHGNSSRVNKIMDKLIEDAEKDEKIEDEAKSFTEQFVECCKNLANAATK